MANFYDYKKINEEVPIEDVLTFHGIYPNSKGWYSIRPEDDTPSAHIDKERRFGNTIRDFGAANTFNPISLTMYLRGVDAVEASQILGDAFNIAPIKRDRTSPDVVSNWEWEQLGVQPDMASKNMEFFPEKYGFEKTKVYAEKFRIPMNELKSTDMKAYENILRRLAIPHVLELRSQYYRSMYGEYNMWRVVNPNVDHEKILSDLMDEHKKMASDLTKAEEILSKALKGTSIKFPLKKSYNVEVDYYKVVEGKVSFEIGNDSYFSISRAAYQDKAQVFECVVSLNDYHKLVQNGLENIHVAATQKGESVKLSFSSTDSSRVHYLGRALLGKGMDIGKNLSHINPDVAKNDKGDEVKGADDKAEQAPVGSESNKEKPLGIC